MALTLNTILRTADIDPAGVLLLRHRDPRVQRQVYAAAVAGHATFEDYQRRQVAPRVIASFCDARHIAGFVVAPPGETVFAGVWELHGMAVAGCEDPFLGPDPVDRPATTFITRRVGILDDYRGKLVIEWGAGQRAWVQRAHLRTKPILEVRKEISEPAFPGFLQFRSRLSEVELLPGS